MRLGSPRVRASTERQQAAGEGEAERRSGLGDHLEDAGRARHLVGGDEQRRAVGAVEGVDEDQSLGPEVAGPGGEFFEITLDVAYRGVTKTDALEDLIVAQADKLDRFCDHIDAIHVAVEKPNESVKTGNGYRVSVDVTVPPGHVINARHEVQDGEPGQGPNPAVRDAFHHARRQLTELNDKQKGHVKTHDESKDLPAEVTKLFPDYGFAQTPEGREIYFHRNAVVEGDFEHLEKGATVAYAEEQGVEGPQARHVRPIAGPEEPPRSVFPSRSEPPSAA